MTVEDQQQLRKKIDAVEQQPEWNRTCDLANAAWEDGYKDHAAVILASALIQVIEQERIGELSDEEKRFITVHAQYYAQTARENQGFI